MDVPRKNYVQGVRLYVVLCVYVYEVNEMILSNIR